MTVPRGQMSQGQQALQERRAARGVLAERAAQPAEEHLLLELMEPMELMELMEPMEPMGPQEQVVLEVPAGEWFS